MLKCSLIYTVPLNVKKRNYSHSKHEKPTHRQQTGNKRVCEKESVCVCALSLTEDHLNRSVSTSDSLLTVKLIPQNPLQTDSSMTSQSLSHHVTQESGPELTNHRAAAQNTGGVSSQVVCLQDKHECGRRGRH